MGASIMANKKTTLIVDDHPLFREGVKTLIEHTPQFTVVGEAGNGKEALAMAKALRPDLVLLDLSLPDQSGVEVTQQIRAFLPNTRVIIVSMHSKVELISKAFQAGATGYVVKESATEKLVEGLEAVSKGEYFLDSALSQKVVSKLVESSGKASKSVDARYESLTPREQQVLRLLVEGLSAKEIAEKLFISPKTVENHRTNIMNKLDIHSTMQLVRYAAKLGLIDVDLWKE
jgi:DNA-binding NarL/FixJ family response regulator